MIKILIFNLNTSQFETNKNLPYVKRFQFLSCFLVLMLLGFTVQAKTTYALRGNVTDDIGDTIPGATVQIKNTNLGVVTDVSGDYMLQVNVDKGNFRSIDLLTKEITVTLDTQVIEW